MQVIDKTADALTSEGRFDDEARAAVNKCTHPLEEQLSGLHLRSCRLLGIQFRSDLVGTQVGVSMLFNEPVGKGGFPCAIGTANDDDFVRQGVSSKVTRAANRKVRVLEVLCRNSTCGA